MGRSQGSVKKHLRGIEAPEKANGVATLWSDQRQLRPPPAAHPLQNSYCRRAESVSDYPQQHSSPPRASRDPEKASLDYQPMQSHRLSSHRTTSANFDEDEGEFDEEDDDPKRHAVWILIYLSALANLLTLPIAIYTLLTTILLLLLSPFFLLLKRRPLSVRFYRFLTPLPKFQLGLIFSSYDTHSATYYSGGSIAILVLVNIFAPFYALFITVSAWISGAFWFYTAILGNPDGKEERDDGREAVLRVRGLWEWWLIRGLG